MGLTLAATETLPSELAPSGSPQLDVRLITRSDGQSARPDLHRLVHQGYWLHRTEMITWPYGCLAALGSSLETLLLGRMADAADRFQLAPISKRPHPCSSRTES